MKFLTTCLCVVVEPGSVGEVPLSNPVSNHQTMLSITSSSSLVQGLNLANQFIRCELNQSARGELGVSIIVASPTLINICIYLGLMVIAGPRQDMVDIMRQSLMIICSGKL